MSDDERLAEIRERCIPANTPWESQLDLRRIATEDAPWLLALVERLRGERDGLREICRKAYDESHSELGGCVFCGCGDDGDNEEHHYTDCVLSEACGHRSEGA